MNAILEHIDDISSKSPNLFLYALWPDWSYSSTVANTIAGKIVHEQWPFYKCRTQQRKYDYILPALRLTTTNQETISTLSGSDLWIVPFANQLWGVVAGNMKLMKQLLKQWNAFNILGWYSLRIQHVLACRPESNIDDIESVHSHPQAIIQCHEKLIELWCVSVEEVAEWINRWPEPWEVMICRAQDWKNFEMSWYTLIQKWFQDDQRSIDQHGEQVQRYTVFTSGEYDPDTSKIHTVLWTKEALEACQSSITWFDTIQRVPEKSTTCHIPSLQLNEAVICSMDAVKSAWLKVLDDQFCPEDNTTHFAVLQKSRGKHHIPWLQTLDTHRKICTIEFHSPEKEENIRTILEEARVKILFEDREQIPQAEMFTWVIEVPNSRNKVTKMITKINEQSWSIQLI